MRLSDKEKKEKLKSGSRVKRHKDLHHARKSLLEEPRSLDDYLTFLSQMQHVFTKIETTPKKNSGLNLKL